MLWTKACSFSSVASNLLISSYRSLFVIYNLGILQWLSFVRGRCPDAQITHGKHLLGLEAPLEPMRIHDQCPALLKGLSESLEGGGTLELIMNPLYIPSLLSRLRSENVVELSHRILKVGLRHCTLITL